MKNNIDLTQAKILIVDDVSANREVLEHTLEAEGYNIVQAPNGKVALDIAPRSFPDLIILDIMMPPGIDGFETCRKLKSNKVTRDIPVIFISALGDTRDLIEGFQAGGVDYITKPFKGEEVQARVKTHLSLKLIKEKLKDQNRILEVKVKERTKELYETKLEIIHRLGRAAEYRDDLTGLHIHRVSRFCGLLGHAKGLNETEVEQLINASPMHDVGKIAIPDRILLKPGKLDPDEWKIMQTHVTIGAELLSGSSSKLIQEAQTIALTHHERWDGSGYMNGLKGEDIPLAGHICALCDVFDALTSERPYKKAWSVEDAMAEIESQSGKQFDPHLIELFKQLLPEIRKIKEQFSD